MLNWLDVLFPAQGQLLGMSLGETPDALVDHLGQPSKRTPRALQYRFFELDGGLTLNVQVKLNKKGLVSSASGTLDVPHDAVVFDEVLAGIQERRPGRKKGREVEITLPQSGLIIIGANFNDAMNCVEVVFRLQQNT